MHETIRGLEDQSTLKCAAPFFSPCLHTWSWPWSLCTTSVATSNWSKRECEDAFFERRHYTPSFGRIHIAMRQQHSHPVRRFFSRVGVPTGLLAVQITFLLRSLPSSFTLSVPVVSLLNAGCKPPPHPPLPPCHFVDATPPPNGALSASLGQSWSRDAHVGMGKRKHAASDGARELCR